KNLARVIRGGGCRPRSKPVFGFCKWCIVCLAYCGRCLEQIVIEVIPGSTLIRIKKQKTQLISVKEY
ncbi:hypothetical protein C0J52_09513, partial [Blattella germanica]